MSTTLSLLTFDNVREAAQSYISPKDFAIIEAAYKLAQKAHSEQRRQSGEAYIQHPLHVCYTLAKLHLDPATLAAAFLHDVVEDTTITMADIRKQFGWRIASLVDGVTKLDAIEERKGLLAKMFQKESQPLTPQERRLESLRKMLLATSKDVRVVLIKLADRLHNMETLTSVDLEKQRRIAEETLQIYAPIAYRLGIGAIKGRLEDLAFATLEPEAYKQLQNKVKHEATDRERQIERAKRIIMKELAQTNIKTEIHTRLKHLYSLHRKLQRYDNDIKQVYDLVACRIIVETIEECYQVLGIIHRRWKPVDSRIKDYIAFPKANGYQSLHTTVTAVEDRPIEIQIRTRTMHMQAEYGVAAHWHYSEQKGTLAYLRRKVSSPSKNELAWVNELARWQQQTTSYAELDKLMKIDFFGDRIFAYTPKGEVIDLPLGSTPIDFAYAIHTDIGNHLAGAKVNGKMIRLQDPLRSGDVVEIFVQRKATPKQDWLNECQTNLAKSEIRRALRRQS